ncbi:MAG TPA: ATPase domain-containing protein [Longimicrobiaceae bacterium]|nr:ATPase domain-containing protein [Longimicrobiaceae bacterium]
MTDRVCSGSERLDAVLSGGLMPNSINVVMGLPGSGKTILAQQYVFENAREDRPALYLSTVSEPLEKILRYGQTLSFFDPDAIGSRVFYEDLGTSLNHQDALTETLGRIVALLRERRPGLIVIDSFKALHPFAPDATAFRRFLQDLAGNLSAYPATSLWVGEYGPDEIGVAPEFAVADGIISLASERADGRDNRSLQVMKLRGSGFLNGKHGYRLSADGIDVFPRLADPVDQASYTQEEERISSGIALLDQALDAGIWPGAATLIAGPPGSGKTLLGLHFIFKGAEMGEPGLIAGLQENPTQLERIVNGFGWSLDRDDVHLMYRSPVDIYLDEWVYELLAMVEEHGIRRVLIDSMGDMRAAASDEVRFREFVYSLFQRFARARVSVFMTQEVAELFGVTRLSEFGISHLSDNVVLLQFLRGESRIKRALTVMKTRASGHDPRILEFTITPTGIELGDEFAADQSWA